MSAISNRRKLMIYIILLTGGLLMIAPLYWSLITSLKSPAEAFDGKWLLSLEKIHWQNYVDVVKILPFGRFFLNSLFIAASITILQVFTSSLAAYAFARLRFPGRDKVFLFISPRLWCPDRSPSFRFISSSNILVGSINIPASFFRRLSRRSARFCSANFS
ncbi:MAG: hypothetical protein ONB46_10310 [candidate division KSB1 bacterium]|nr:hypothetical protein [candidate division KSB1 bacterium]MDZ7366197.1 hypothetical protein [candidate division KSB1 bacterium]MDZ7404415.1 hypothetical protein [candidate division KSB1 bacterium]